jgi:hypothetical protein
MRKLSYIRTLQVLSAFLGFAGTTLMVWGVLASTPNDIAKLGGLYFGINPNYLQSIADSRANTIIGILIVSLAFLFQIFIHVFENKLNNRYLNITKINITICIISIVTTITGIYLIHSKLIDNTIFTTHKELAYLSLEKQYNYNKNHNKVLNGKVILEKGQIDVIKNHMEELSFNKLPGESEAEYFARFYKYLGHDFANQIDFKESGVQ